MKKNSTIRRGSAESLLAEKSHNTITPRHKHKISFKNSGADEFTTSGFCLLAHLWDVHHQNASFTYRQCARPWKDHRKLQLHSHRVRQDKNLTSEVWSLSLKLRSTCLLLNPENPAVFRQQMTFEVVSRDTSSETSSRGCTDTKQLTTCWRSSF